MFPATAALAAGAVMGRRVWGVGVGAGVAVVGYVLQAVANNSEDLDWLRVFSPFDWAFGDAPLTNGAIGPVWPCSGVDPRSWSPWRPSALARKDVLG